MRFFGYSISNHFLLIRPHNASIIIHQYDSIPPHRVRPDTGPPHQRAASATSVAGRYTAGVALYSEVYVLIYLQEQSINSHLHFHRCSPHTYQLLGVLSGPWCTSGTRRSHCQAVWRGARMRLLWSAIFLLVVVGSYAQEEEGEKTFFGI